MRRIYVVIASICLLHAFGCAHAGSEHKVSSIPPSAKLRGNINVKDASGTTRTYKTTDVGGGVQVPHSNVDLLPPVDQGNTNASHAQAWKVQLSDGSAAFGTNANPVRTSPASGTATQPVSQGTAAANSGSWPVKVSDGTDSVGISTVGGGKALKVDVVQSVGSAGGTSSSVGAAFPASGTAAGFSDGTNMQGGRVHDMDSGGGTEYDQGVTLRFAGSGGSVAAATNTNPLRVDPTGSTTQPVSASALPLPTGASTSAKQPALGTAGSASSDVITVQGIASMTALKTDGSAVTQPVSGTVTVSSVSTSIVPGTGATNLGKAEDAAHTTADTGVEALTVRSDTSASTAGSNGDYAALISDAGGKLWTRTTPDYVENATYWQNITSASTQLSTSLDVRPYRTICFWVTVTTSSSPVGSISLMGSVDNSHFQALYLDPNRVIGANFTGAGSWPGGYSIPVSSPASGVEMAFCVEPSMPYLKLAWASTSGGTAGAINGGYFARAN